MPLIRVSSLAASVAALCACLASFSAGAQPLPAAAPATNPPGAEPTAPTRRGEAMLMLDYQAIKVPNGGPDIDLAGAHLLNRMNDWLYLGFGAYAPLVKGEYGGFMAVDVTGHVQRKVFGNLFVDGGLSLGGGGGGKSVQQSKQLSGTGGFAKAYVGLGYDFGDFTAGVNWSKMKFRKSTIDSDQVNLYVQVPFSYTVGDYADAGRPAPLFGGGGAPAESILSLGLDNYRQVRPKGSNKDTINVADLFYGHFLTKDVYWFATAGVGYHGLPLYNQLLGGLGVRKALTDRINLYGQVGVGSGGYAPDTIDTGPGLLVYPKVSAEFMLDRNLGLSLSGGYLFAPNGSSKNWTLGAALNYHLHTGDTGGAAGVANVFRGYRLSLFQQTEVDVKLRGVERGNLNMLTAQADHVVNANVYVPVQVSVAYNAYLGYPGYGELLAGLGLQSRHARGDRVQWFGQFTLGANVHGPIAKAGVGVNVGINDRLALYGTVGQTASLDSGRFRASYAGLGLSYRFSVPGS